jgi:hypothetical protein
MRLPHNCVRVKFPWGSLPSVRELRKRAPVGLRHSATGCDCCACNAKNNNLACVPAAPATRPRSVADLSPIQRKRPLHLTPRHQIMLYLRPGRDYTFMKQLTPTEVPVLCTARDTHFLDGRAARGLPGAQVLNAANRESLMFIQHINVTHTNNHCEAVTTGGRHLQLQACCLQSQQTIIAGSERCAHAALV